MEKQIFLSGWKRPEGVNIYPELAMTSVDGKLSAYLDTWWLEGVLGREEEHAVVLAACIYRVGWATLCRVSGRLQRRVA